MEKRNESKRGGKDGKKIALRLSLFPANMLYNMGRGNFFYNSLLPPVFKNKWGEIQEGIYDVYCSSDSEER